MHYEFRNDRHAHVRRGRRQKEVCTTCGKDLKGRSDKVYCDIDCKNKHHAAARNVTHTFVKDHAKLLAKNLKSIFGFLQEGNDSVVVTVAQLEAAHYAMDVVTRVELKKSEVKLYVGPFEMEYLPGNLVRFSICQLMEEEVEEVLRSLPEEIRGYFFKRYKRKYPEVMNGLDVERILRRARMGDGMDKSPPLPD